MAGGDEHGGKESDPPHNDKEHDKADKNGPNDPHWEKAHGSGVPDKPTK